MAVGWATRSPRGLDTTFCVWPNPKVIPGWNNPRSHATPPTIWWSAPTSRPAWSLTSSGDRGGYVGLWMVLIHNSVYRPNTQTLPSHTRAHGSDQCDGSYWWWLLARTQYRSKLWWEVIRIPPDLDRQGLTVHHYCQDFFFNVYIRICNGLLFHEYNLTYHSNMTLLTSDPNREQMLRLCSYNNQLKDGSKNLP